MGTRDEQNLHALLAALRALFASLTDKDAGFSRNFELGAQAFSAGPAASVWMVTQISAIRLQQLDELVTPGRASTDVPTQRLLNALPPSTVVPDAVELLRQMRAGQIVDMHPYEAYAKKHGLPGLMFSAQVSNEIGRMLVELDSRYADLSDLLRQEAAADETDWWS